MKRIYYIPIEPLNERYTEQWYRWFPDMIKQCGAECIIIDGIALTNTIKTGTFLDINSTLHYKATQLQTISKLFYENKIKDGDIFFIADIEFWGIESIRYLADLNNIKIKLFGFNHAGSYTAEDFMQKCEPYAKYYEEAWFNTYDKIFVGSEYHKNQMCKLRNAYEDNIIVTGNPYNINEELIKVGPYIKKDQIILTNRPDYEKRPNISLDIFMILKEKYPQYKFIVTTSRKQWGNGWIRDKALQLQKNNIIEIKENLLKINYLKLVAESKIMLSNSIEENFGYCILESLIFNTIPVLTNNYSHIELVQNDSRLLFDTIDEAIIKITNLIENPIDISNYANRYQDSLYRIISIMLN